MKNIYLSGKYVNDLAMRFSYSGIDQSKLIICENIQETAENIAANGSEDLYVVTCFSDRDKFLAHTRKEQ